MAHRPEAAAGVADLDLSDQTVLVTGSTSGIGRETALALGRLGARVLVHGRDRDQGAAAVAALEDAGSPDPAFLPADFEEQGAVERFAEAVRDRVERLDVLVHNAGAHYRRGALTADGVERTVAVNHLAPFELTARLVGWLSDGGDRTADSRTSSDRSSDAARVVVVASETHRRVGLDLEAFTDVAGYDGLAAYSRSKLANVLFVRALARRLDGPVANALHPGFVPGSAIWRDAPWYVRAATWTLARLPRTLSPGLVSTPAEGAETVVYLAAAPEAGDVSGAYYSDHELVEPSTAARDDALAEALWAESERLTGVAWPAEARTPVEV